MPPWAALATLWVSLHTADPGAGGSQATSEATYGGYVRMGVGRDAGGWTVSGPLLQNAVTITFPSCSSGSNTITWVGIGTSAFPAAGELLHCYQLASPVQIAGGYSPYFSPGALRITEG